MKIGVILAGGKSSRFQSALPKGLHKIDGKSIVNRIIESFDLAGINKIYVVVNNDSYKYYHKELYNVDFLFQDKINGTGSAFYCVNGLFSANDEVIVINSDCFLFDKFVIKKFYEECVISDYRIGLVVRKEKENYGYGRVKIDDGFVCVKEEYELVEEEKLIDNINVGIYFFRGVFLEKYIKELNNDCGENKITHLLTKERSFVYQSDSLILGINSKDEFIKVRKKFYLYNNDLLIKNGVKIYDPNITYIGENVKIGKDVEIYPNTYVLGESFIGDNSVVLPNCYIEDSHIGEMCNIGPFSHLKKGTYIENNVVIGAFVEVKNSVIKNEVKAKHHAYIGDASIGEKTNIGCGVIFANYDGNKKQRSYVGKSNFIGCNTTFVSPVKLGDNVIVAAGSTIVEDISDNSLSIARERQINKENYYNSKLFSDKKNH